jgi:WD40 repeat protein
MSLKIFTGDCLGLLKVTDFPNVKNIEAISSRISKENEIQNICISKDKNFFYVFRDKIVEKYAFDTLECKSKFEYESLIIASSLSKNEDIITLHKDLRVEYRCGDEEDKEMYGKTRFQRELHLSNNDSLVFSVNEYNNNIFAVGGKDVDLHVFDISIDEPIFKSKRVKNNNLDMAIPIHITCLGWLNENQIVTGSKYHEIRVYNILERRRPIKDFKHENLIRSLTIINENEIIFSDNLGNLIQFDLVKGKKMGAFRGFSGTIVSSFIIDDKLLSVGKDRHLYIHDLRNRKVLAKVYLKQSLTCVVGAKTFNEGDDDDERSFDGLWEDHFEEENQKKRQKIN